MILKNYWLRVSELLKWVFHILMKELCTNKLSENGCCDCTDSWSKANQHANVWKSLTHFQRNPTNFMCQFMATNETYSVLTSESKHSNILILHLHKGKSVKLARKIMALIFCDAESVLLEWLSSSLLQSLQEATNLLDQLKKKNMWENAGFIKEGNHPSPC